MMTPSEAEAIHIGVRSFDKKLGEQTKQLIQDVKKLNNLKKK